MKNLNFVDPDVPDVVSKQEILAHLKERLSLENAVIEWLDSITNEAALTPDEADVVYKLLEGNIIKEWRDPITNEPKTCDLRLIYTSGLVSYRYICKPILLFDSAFFSDVQDDSVSFLKRFFRTDRLNDERIQNIPLLFGKIDDKEVFYSDIEDIIEGIRSHCAQNAEFAKAYQAKLAEIRNNNGSLQERVAFYVDNGIDNVLIRELEQPAFEMLRKYLNGDTISEYSVLDLLFVSRMQTPDGMQIPRWNEKNYLCRLLLDYAITGKAGILDKLFSDHTTTDVVLIICDHLKWRNRNIPQYYLDWYMDDAPKSHYKKHLKKHRKEYAKFLESQLPELFNYNISQKYSRLLHDYFFAYYLDAEDEIVLEDIVRDDVSSFLNNYLTEEIVSAINENNHEQIRDISRLFDDENKDRIEENDINGKNWLQSRISVAMQISESDDQAEKWQDILKASKDDDYFLKFLLNFLVKNQKDDPPLSLEDFAQKYIPLEIFPEILHFDFFQEQNEDVYQNMIQQYPGLSREDALLDRLLPCFAAIAIKNTDRILAISNRGSANFCWHQLLLCVLDQLCEQYEKEHELIALIFEIIFSNMCSRIMFDITKKYPQIQQLIFEHCYAVIKKSWDTPICTPVSSHQIEAHVPAHIIGMHMGAWYGLKPLLIALRKTRMEWVDANLNINMHCHPNGNRNLVMEIERYFNSFRDESLKSLRQDMADGLSEWLKPLPESKRGNLEKRLAEFPKTEQDRDGFDITYTEPDPIWRYAYLRAIADLGVDVDGKGHYIHSVMDKVAQKDPSEMVRKAAEKASAKLKNLRNGWDGEEHYQKINFAFWWIKQASRLALNLPVDRKTALARRSIHKEQDSYSSRYERDYDKEEKEEKKQKEEEKERVRQREKIRKMELAKLTRARLKI